MDDDSKVLERTTISAELHEKYEQCCIQLIDLIQGMEAYFKENDFQHRLFTGIREQAVTDTDWAKVISTYTIQEDSRRSIRPRKSARWEEWEIFPNRLYCSQYSGWGDKPDLKTFQSLVLKGQCILANYLSLMSTLPEFLHWRLSTSLVLPSTITDLPGYYYLIYLINRSGPTSPGAWYLNGRLVAREYECIIDRITFRVRSHKNFVRNAADILKSWLPPAWLLDLVEPQSSTTPRWDNNQRELWYGDLLIKQYRQKFGTQEATLETFQEEGWPTSIDDPLPSKCPKPESEPRRRLRDTVNDLNKHHINPDIIHFDKNGHSNKVTWGLGPRPKTVKYKSASSAKSTRH